VRLVKWTTFLNRVADIRKSWSVHQITFTPFFVAWSKCWLIDAAPSLKDE
jgi:hypothetical protein